MNRTKKTVKSISKKLSVCSPEKKGLEYEKDTFPKSFPWKIEELFPYVQKQKGKK